jgi:DNA-directed RNA polymerase specialized sigma24 family protein
MTRPIDRTAIDRLAVEHLPMALRMALRLSGDADAAEDLVQETLCRVLRQWRTYRSEGINRLAALRSRRSRRASLKRLQRSNWGPRHQNKTSRRFATLI